MFIRRRCTVLWALRLRIGAGVALAAAVERERASFPLRLFSSSPPHAFEAESQAFADSSLSNARSNRPSTATSGTSPATQAPGSDHSDSFDSQPNHARFAFEAKGDRAAEI